MAHGHYGYWWRSKEENWTSSVRMKEICVWSNSLCGPSRLSPWQCPDAGVWHTGDNLHGWGFMICFQPTVNSL